MKEFKKSTLFVSFVLITGIVLNFSGCRVFENVTHYSYEQNLRIDENLGLYEYSEKVQLRLSRYYGYGEDTLTLRDSDEEYETFFFHGGYEILSGHFRKLVWNSNELFIMMDEIYYVFDIEKYTIPPVDENGNLTYELKEYTEEEFAEAYPDYKSYPWKVREGILTAFEELTFTSLPKRAEIVEYKDTRNIPDDGLFYVSAIIKLKDNKETIDFIENIKQSWIAPSIKDYEEYDEINKIAFSKNLVPYSDDYYYFYVNDYYDNKEYDFYYGDFFTLIAFDEESKTIYLYSSDMQHHDYQDVRE